jgi:hypothetical protein
MAVAARGATANMKTTVLMTGDEGFDALTAAQSVAYSPPV